MSLDFDVNLVRGDFQLTAKASLSTTGVTAIYGHSGAGKTSLLRWFAGLENSTGTLSFNQEFWQKDNTFAPTQKRQIAYVFQDARLFPHLDVAGNLNYAYQRRFNNNGPNISQVTEWFELSTLMHSNTATLSGGEQQRVAMARALLSSPQLIFMDEPLGSLDEESKERILKHIENLPLYLSAPIFYVSHSLEEVSRLADQLLVMEKGKIIAQGSMLDLSSQLSLSLSHEANAAGIITARVKSHDKKFHLTELIIGEKSAMFTASINNNIGDTVRLRVPAKDVSIALQHYGNSSIQNILPCVIDEIDDTLSKDNHSQVTLRLRLEDQFILARLTRKSVETLALFPGQNVYAQIKSVALINEALSS